MKFEASLVEDSPNADHRRFFGQTRRVAQRCEARRRRQAGGLLLLLSILLPFLTPLALLGRPSSSKSRRRHELPRWSPSRSSFASTLSPHSSRARSRLSPQNLTASLSPPLSEPSFPLVLCTRLSLLSSTSLAPARSVSPRLCSPRPRLLARHLSTTRFRL